MGIVTSFRFTTWCDVIVWFVADGRSTPEEFIIRTTKIRFSAALASPPFAAYKIQRRNKRHAHTRTDRHRYAEIPTKNKHNLCHLLELFFFTNIEHRRKFHSKNFFAFFFSSIIEILLFFPNLLWLLLFLALLCFAGECECCSFVRILESLFQFSNVLSYVGKRCGPPLVYCCSISIHRWHRVTVQKRTKPHTLTHNIHHCDSFTEIHLVCDSMPNEKGFISYAVCNHSILDESLAIRVGIHTHYTLV